MYILKVFIVLCMTMLDTKTQYSKKMKITLEWVVQIYCILILANLEKILNRNKEKVIPAFVPLDTLQFLFCDFNIDI